MSPENSMGRRCACRYGLLALPALVMMVVLLTDRAIHGLVPASHFIGGTVNAWFLTGGYLLLFGLAWRKHEWQDLRLALSTCIAVTAVVQIPKLSLVTPLALRPDGSPGGLPSGHTAASFALAFLLSRKLPHLSAAWYLIAVVVSWSRIEAHAHWTFQVLISAPLGLAIARFLDDKAPVNAISERSSSPLPTSAEQMVDQEESTRA